MPQVEVTIGGRQFEVACQDGEEPFLRKAAALLDGEAAAIGEQIGRIPESRMLLMAGLLLADKTTSLEDRLREAERKVAALESELAHRPKTVEVPVEVPVEVRVEIPVIPQEVRQLFTEVAEETEALAHAMASLLPARRSEAG